MHDLGKESIPLPITGTIIVFLQCKTLVYVLHQCKKRTLEHDIFLKEKK
jgi:hypothetical protein